MNSLSRRSFVASASSLPFSLWLEKVARALPPPAPLIRHNARSPEGKAMLQTYADAAKTMKSGPSSDPTSWVFQWYTHAVNGDTSKAAELTRIYPAATGSQFMLAQKTWDTCMAHFSAEETYFLPWHRMFVYFFERIVRKISGKPEFVLPYWNYSVADPAVHGVLPPEFLDQSDPLLKWLYQGNRNLWANQGKAIDINDPGALDLGVMQEQTYGPNGADDGFCANLDGGLHGNVHVDVGAAKNMGQIPYAANDAIFWMHHCNIDRLWASWNRNGGHNPKDPTWLSRQFTFADENGNQVIATVKDFTDIASLDYTYEEFEPGRVVPNPRIVEATPRPVLDCIACGGPLGAKPVRVILEAPRIAEATPGPPFQERVTSMKEDKRLYLALRDLRTNLQPGVLYHVYLDLPEKVTPKEGQDHHVGAINFFDAAGHREEKAPAEGKGRSRSFDITQLARRLQSRKLLSEKPAVTIAPSREPISDAKPVIGRISVFEQ
jgi:tyrosinase